MTLTAFVTLLKTADSKVTKNKSNGETNYTIWTPYQDITVEYDGISEIIGQRIQVDRFTLLDADSVVPAITAALIGRDDLSMDIQPMIREDDTGYFHFIWDCEVAYG